MSTSIKAVPFFFVLMTSVAASATTTYNLADDFSNTANPNNAWSFTYNGALLSHVVSSNPNNEISTISPTGYWGTGGDPYMNTPDVIKSAVDGSIVANKGYSNGAFLSGDVLVHSPNPGSTASQGAPVLINWTAPSDGTVSWNASIWYAHQPVQRSNDVSVLYNGNVTFLPALVSYSSAQNRNLPISFSAGPINVTAGWVLSLALAPTLGQQYGSLDGVSEIVTFTPALVPEPSVWLMLCFGMGLLAPLHRRARHAPNT